MENNFFVCLLLGFMACGCGKESTVRESFNDIVDDVVFSVQSPQKRFDSLGKLNTLMSMFRTQTNAVIRSCDVRAFAAKVERTYPSLQGTDYESYVVCVRRYKLNVGYVITALEEFGEDAGFRMKCYATMMTRYKKLSFGIPWTAKGAEEDLVSFNKRMNAAYVLFNEYEEEVSGWKRFTFPRIRRNTPKAFQKQFEKTVADILNYPSRDEFDR